MSSIRFLVTLILVSLLVSGGCGGSGSNKDKDKDKNKSNETKKEERPSEPSEGPGGAKMK